MKPIKSINICLKYTALLFGLLFIVITGCTSQEISDAYGQFEATEITISTEVGGVLLDLRVDEGLRLKKDQKVALVDTARLVLTRNQLEAQMQSVQSRIQNVNAEIEVLKQELHSAEKDFKRVTGLMEDGAATEKQYDDALAHVKTIKKKINALETQKQTIRAEINANRARIDQVNEDITDAAIVNPVNGTVLTSFVEQHEMVQPGQPLYRIADLDSLILRVYVSGAQLPEVKLNQQVEVLIDKNKEENQVLYGRVRWIASNAEFTPQQIQTKEERVTQVYAVEVLVPNPEGVLKIGMPGEVNFK